MENIRPSRQCRTRHNDLRVDTAAAGGWPVGSGPGHAVWAEQRRCCPSQACSDWAGLTRMGGSRTGSSGPADRWLRQQPRLRNQCGQTETRMVQARRPRQADSEADGSSSVRAGPTCRYDIVPNIMSNHDACFNDPASPSLGPTDRGSKTVAKPRPMRTTIQARAQHLETTKRQT